MFRPTTVDLNPVKLKYNPFVINLDKCCGNCNVFSPNICIPKKAKGKNNKAFNIITNKNEVKTMTNIFLVIANPNFFSRTCHSNQKWNNKTYQCECKN